MMLTICSYSKNSFLQEELKPGQHHKLHSETILTLQVTLIMNVTTTLTPLHLLLWIIVNTVRFNFSWQRIMIKNIKYERNIFLKNHKEIKTSATPSPTHLSYWIYYQSISQTIIIIINVKFAQCTLFVRLIRPHTEKSNFIFAVFNNTLRVGDCNQEQGKFCEERNAVQSKPSFKTLHKFPKKHKNQCLFPP